MKMTIYRSLIGASLAILNTAKRENVWGHDMLVKTIDASDKEQVEQAQADGWQKTPQAVIDENEGLQLEAENKALKGQINNAETLQKANELEQENLHLKQENERLTAENEDLKGQLTKAEKAKEKADAQAFEAKLNDMTVPELEEYLTSKKIEHASGLKKADLIKLAQAAK